MMSLPRVVKTTGLTLLALMMANMAAATTYSNTNDSTIIYFGSPDTTSYGQVFNTGNGVLSDWTFQANSGTAGNLQLVVASWNGSQAVGPALYSSSAFAYAGGSEALSFTGINTSLSAGNYIAYLTVAGVVKPASNVGIAGSNSDGGLTGGFRFLNSGGVDPLTQNQAWSSWYVPNMNYQANISPAPEPETYALMLGGLGLVGAITRRRKANQQ